MLIEITGSLGSGKTALTQKLVRQFASEGVPVRAIDVGGRLSADPLTIPWAPLFAARHPRLFQLVVGAAVRDAGSFRIRSALLWNIMRKAGMSERLAGKSGREVVIWDEGAVHMAHNAFAHIGCPPRPNEVLEFGALVPKPDLLVRVRASENVALTRVLSRGHKRTAGDASAITSLLTNAERVYCLLAQVDSLRDRTLDVDNDSADLNDLDSHVEVIVRLVRQSHHTGAR
jgi:thymidylate kinase